MTVIHAIFSMVLFCVVVVYEVGVVLYEAVMVPVDAVRKFWRPRWLIKKNENESSSTSTSH
jgi:hypothetical protein